MGFMSSILTGSNPVLSGNINKAGQVAGWGTSKGEGLMGQAGDMISGLLGGDPAKAAKLLAPQIATQQKMGQQQKQTMSQFGTRSGGTAAKGQTIDDTSRANIGKMISELTGSALGAAGSVGQSMLDIGMKSLGMQTDMSQQQMENWSNSVLGKGITTGAAALEKTALMGMGMA